MTVGGNSNLLVSQSFEVTPCCSGPAPMIIERARAEQQLGVLPALPAVPRPNPLHGLAIGFSLSLVTGAGLYMLLAGG